MNHTETESNVDSGKTDFYIIPQTDQVGITVIAPVKKSKISGLRELLKSIGEEIERNSILPLPTFEGVHFCRLALLEATENYPAQLVYATNVDDSLKKHLTVIQHNEQILNGLNLIFSHCENYEMSGSPFRNIERFIRTHTHPIHTFYLGHRGLSLEQIRLEDEVYQSIQEYLDSRSFKNVPGSEIHHQLKEYIKKKSGPIGVPKIRLKSKSIKALLFLYIIFPIIALLGISCLFGIFQYAIAAIAIILVLIFVTIRLKERAAPELIPEMAVLEDIQDQTRKLRKFEDYQVQNQLTHLVELRPGWIRRTLQKAGLAVLNKLARLTYNKGRLGNIATIHFARWSIIDSGKRLLFFSNFDGSWENYLGDFVDRAAVGLTLAWSNTSDFPKTFMLVFNGATNEELFKAWTRKNQIVTNVWYTAYKHLTVKNILRNHAVALGLLEDSMDEESLEKWLKLL